MTAKKGGTRERANSGHQQLSVREGESAWTAEELAEVQGELEEGAQRLQREVEEAEHDLLELSRNFGDGAGDDQADAGSATLEREQELSLANNAKDLLAQHQQALLRIESGAYGDCASCGTPIGKMRLQAFPRATLCLSCKQKQERR